MTLGRIGRVAARQRAATLVWCALALAAGQLVGGAATAVPPPGDAGPAGGPGSPWGGDAALPALADDLDRQVAPEHRRAVPRTPPASVAGAGDAGDAAAGAGGAGRCAAANGACDGGSIPPPPDSEVAAAVRSTGSGVLDYPGRYQVDPATGQIVDTGIASQPTEPVDVVVATTTTVPPPVSPPTPTTTTTSPPAPTTTAPSETAP